MAWLDAALTPCVWLCGSGLEQRVVYLRFPVFFLNLRRSEVERLVVRYVLETSGLQPAELVSVSRVGAGQPAHRLRNPYWQLVAGQRRAISIGRGITDTWDGCNCHIPPSDCYALLILSCPSDLVSTILSTRSTRDERLDTQ